MSLQYSIVRFSPNPEEIERVGVAIYLWSTKQLVYDEAFPRLHCLAPGFSRRMLVHSLRHLERKLEGRVVAVTPGYFAQNGLRLGHGRLITDLDNLAFPMIRYRNGDAGKVATGRGGRKPALACGFHRRWLACGQMTDGWINRGITVIWLRP